MKKKKNNENNENKKTTNGMLLTPKGYAFWGRQKNFIDKFIKKKSIRMGIIEDSEIRNST